MDAGRLKQWLSLTSVVLGLSYAFSTTTFAVTDVALSVSALLVVAHWYVSRDWYWPLRRKDQRVALYFGLIVVLGALFLPYDDLVFGLITLYLIGSFFVVRYLRELGLAEAIVKGYVIGAFGSALYGVTWWLWWHEPRERYQFVFDDPNVYGAFLVPATLFFMWRVLAKQTDVSYRTINLLGASITYSALILTLSRGAWLQAGVALGVLLLIMLIGRQFDRASYKVLTAGIALIIVGGIVTSASLSELMISRYSSSDASRIDNLYHATETISDLSLHQFAIGLGNGSYERFSIDGFAAHNTYLRVLFENGLIGLGLFLFLILGVVYKNRREFHKPLPAVLLASLAGIVVHSLVIDTLHWRHLWLIFGLL